MNENRIYAMLGDLDERLIVDNLPPTMAAMLGQPAPRRRHPLRAVGRFLETGWGIAAACTVVSLGVLFAVVAAGRITPAVGPGASTTPPEISETVGNILLPGEVPYAPEAGSYTISTDLMIPADTTRLRVTLTAKETGTTLPTPGAWQLEKLVGPAWDGDLLNPEIAWEIEPKEGVYATIDHSMYLEGELTPGIYRLYAMKYVNGSGYLAEAFCEFAVDDEKGTYKTWTEADLEGAAHVAATHTISLPAQLPYGTREITVTFTGPKGTNALHFPAACRLVKLDGTAGAGAAFDIQNADLFSAVEFGLAAGSLADFIPSTTQTYTIQNPAAVTPGRYRIYNVDADGAIYASCDFEIIGDPLGWPGEEGAEIETHPYPKADEAPYTIEAEFGPAGLDRDHIYLTIHYTATERGATLTPYIGCFAIRKISGEADDADPLIYINDYGLYPAVPEPDEYATLSDSRRIENPQDMKSGIYRVYALNMYKTAYIDYFDVVWAGYDGQTDAPKNTEPSDPWETEVHTMTSDAPEDEDDPPIGETETDEAETEPPYDP